MAKYKVEEVRCAECGYNFKCKHSDPTDLCQCPKCFEKIRKETITGTVSDLVEDMFSTVANEYQLKTGDVSPEQTLEIDNAKEKLVNILIAYVTQNQKK